MSQAMYLEPGVYVQHAPPSMPAVGNAAGSAGFIGVAKGVQMPDKPGEFERDQQGNLVLSRTGKPIPVPYELAAPNLAQRISSWQAFVSMFGEVQSANRWLASAVYGFFSNGGQACWVLRVEDRVLPADLSTALAVFEEIDEIATVAVPGATSIAHRQSIVAHCARMRDRIAILDAAPESDPLISFGDSDNRELSSYAALYSPWIRVIDPVSGSPILIPPSGHIAGVYARNDATYGVFKAPANEIVEGAVGLGEINLSERSDQTVRPDINQLRSMEGRVKIWGARTLAQDRASVFRYVNTRRYFNFLREAVEEQTQFAVFEPNTPALWQRIRRVINAFLTDQWQAGALFGETSDQAFYVKCDAETNSPEVRSAGEVVTEIGVALVKPAEYVILRIHRLTGIL